MRMHSYEFAPFSHRSNRVNQLRQWVTGCFQLKVLWQFKQRSDDRPYGRNLLAPEALLPQQTTRWLGSPGHRFFYHDLAPNWKRFQFFLHYAILPNRLPHFYQHETSINPLIHYGSQDPEQRLLPDSWLGHHQSNRLLQLLESGLYDDGRTAPMPHHCFLNLRGYSNRYGEKE